MRSLLLALPAGTPASSPSLAQLVAQLREHDYRVVVLAVPAEPALHRLAAHLVFAACEQVTPTARPQPVLVRFRAAPGPAAAQQAPTIEFTSLPPRLRQVSGWLRLLAQPGLAGELSAAITVPPGPLAAPRATLYRFCRVTQRAAARRCLNLATNSSAQF
ncbi:hypothetical protein GKZ68_20680 (plasmid) [Hymenobacter sp. BRD128]|uniref:hypothetical protein n=1 Tax=Hymenobacter sp. BRD128 TaxID=2675878 RepID=UPI0015671228|nr:hypothetical protein [Hymenobacter sp. BRD128]QKG59100.1 hypothetical protein GKZ68_20680 [Hymenobacter sp. BRD128]